MSEFKFTDEQWKDYQNLAPQGYSHRYWLEHLFNAWLAEHDRQVAERTWDAAIAEACEQGTIQIPDNPHRKK